MYLKKLSLANFKNCSEANLIFSEKINCLVGNNGVGKTNVLDGIYYLSFCKSYFNSIDTQNIKHNEEFFALNGWYQKNGGREDQISCVQKRGAKKQFKINKKDYDRLADHIGHFPLVMISPYDRDLINEGSEVRRKYIDGVISQFDKVYLDDLLNYNKALSQRNALLKRFAELRTFDQTSLEIWDDQLAALGQKIHEKRQDFLEEFAPIFQHYFEFISGGKENVSIHYESHLFDNNMKVLFNESLDRDRYLRYTTKGIHKDDLRLKIGDYPIKKFGSQGQQKSYVIAIKLAQFEYTKKKKGYKPILLFDDIFDKLDDQRVEQLISLVSNNSFGQIFITDTQRQRTEKIFKTVNIDHKIFTVDAGIINED
ncbi:MAG: DNA replication and repair protein RecF [Bacteroidetes bacterium]|nr:DNA replication and repair protein RecF [Bacteroidota bacterium]